MSIHETNVVVRDTSVYGMSLYCTRPFKKDELVFTVFGPIVTVPTIYTVPIAHGLYIDPAEFTKYLNHCCDPTCGIKNRSQVVAMYDLQEGEQVAIDYAMIVPFYTTEMTDENRVCRCGSVRCRGKLGAYNELPDEVRQRYAGYISEYLLA